MLDMVVVRLIFAIVLTVTAYYFQPFGLPKLFSAIYGVIASAAIILFEARLRKVSLKRLIGAAIGSTLGFFAATMISSMLIKTSIEPRTLSFLQISLFLLMGYVGLVSGANKGDMLNLSALGGLFGGERPAKRSYKILDTSVIIDGRIADISETGFMEGPLLIPQFVLGELQHIADSHDPIKRTRGKRGLEILHHIQKQVNVDVRIVDTDYPSVKEVDAKLIELAKEVSGKIITNDSNLNKVAGLQGIEVLNINALANSLKPVVLPGEDMNAKIVKEGKEMGQGVAYLDDGTMIVVDNGRRQIGKNVDVTVTSVLQTPAGRMIFARLKEEVNRENRGKDYYYPLDSEF